MDYTEKDLVQLKKSYSNSLDVGDSYLEFKGSVFLVTYVKYLIEYLENEFS